MRARPRAVALHGALLAVLVVGPLAYVTAGKSVTVQADGATQDVRTYASTVGAALAQAGVHLGPHDTVAPPQSAQLSDGMRVDVLRGHRVHLVVDGVARDVWTTASDVQQLAETIGGRFPSAYMSVSRYSRIPAVGMTLDVRMPKSVVVVYGGTPVVVVTTGATWTDVLTQVGLPLDSSTQLSVPAASAPYEGQRVTVVLTGTRTVTSFSTIAFGTVKTTSASLFVGTSSVVSAGRTGVRRETWRYTLHDGVVVSKVLVESVVSAQPVSQVVAVGTRKHAPPTPGYPRTSVDDLNWHALAQCESGGNPRAVGGNGSYFGLYQFSLGAWHSVGGSGSPVDASSNEQTYRAKLLYLQRGGAGAWPYCGQFL